MEKQSREIMAHEAINKLFFVAVILLIFALLNCQQLVWNTGLPAHCQLATSVDSSFYSAPIPRPVTGRFL